MRFLELYESDKPEEKKKDDMPSQKHVITIEKVLADLEHFHDSKKARAIFLNKIHRPGQQPDKAFTYGGDGTRNGAGGKSISYTADVGSNQPSEDFARIIDKIKDRTGWKQEIEEVINLVKNSNQQQYIRAYFIPKVENPGARLTTTGNLRGDNRVPGTREYKIFGQAMVFYAGKCVSRMTDADTKIGPDKFKLIMQGCFGAAPDANGEDDSFLSQFKDLESKLKIDAAKNVILSIHRAGTKDIEGFEVEESYYTGMSYIINNKLFEAETTENNSIECPKTIDEFSKLAGTALKQAKAVAQKYPKQYKIWYEKLRSAFDEGVKDYQDKERDPRLMEKGIENPITGEIEHRNGKAWGAGGPNAFIRNNEYLNNIVQAIKKGTPGCEGVNGWDIFNCGPKLILTIFDALEHGGKIYQKLCDDLSTGMRQIKRALGATKPEDFDKLIKKYASENEHARAMEVSISGVLCALANLYKILANGKIGQLNWETKTFNTENSDSETIIQVRIDQLKTAIAYAVKEKADYEKWKEEEDKKHEEYIKKLESEIAGLSKQSEGQQQQKESTYVVSVKNILTEEEKQNRNQKMVSNAQDELKKKKEELEKAKKNDKTVLKLSNYIAILDDYKDVLGLQPHIKEAYNTISILFNPDAAQEQYQELFNNDANKENDSNEEDNSQQKTDEKVSLSSRLDKILTEYKLFEDEGETVDPNEVDDGDSNKPEDKKKEEPKPEQQNNNQKDDVEVKSENKGNLNWTKQGQAQGLKAIYRIFSEGKDNVRFDLEAFKELAKSKSTKEAFKKICVVLENLQKTLNGLKTVDPIVDGIVACNKIDNPENIPGCIETVKPKSQENNQEEKKEEDKPGDGKDERSKLEVLEDQQKNLISLVDEDSSLMKNIIGKLNELVKNAKDDSWLNEYNSFVQNFNAEGSKILQYIKEIYKNSKKAENWIKQQSEIIERSNILARMWHIISMAKFCIAQLEEQIDSQRTEDLAKEQNAETQNSSYIPISENPSLNEAAPAECSINVVLKKVSEKLSSFNFNAMLPTDYRNNIYNLSDSSKFNEVEDKFASVVGIKYVEGNTIYGMIKQLIGDKTIINALKTKNIAKCAEQINYIHTAKGNKQNPDRNMLLFYGVVHAICNIFGSLNNDIKSKNIRAKASEDTNENYIPEVSPDVLMNEIYKYIRGN